MPSDVFKARRAALLSKLGTLPALIHAGHPRSRNYAANTYPFRAGSHFLYLTGLSIPGASLLLHQGQATLLVPKVAEDDALWHGPQPGSLVWQSVSGVDQIQEIPPAQTPTSLSGPIATLPWPTAPSAADRLLGQAMVDLRLTHDAAALHEMRRAARVTHEAHVAGMQAARTPGVSEAAIRAAIESRIIAHNFGLAYTSIVTTHGDILHTNRYDHLCQAGDLLLADVGSESDTGWASDVTRTYPIGGRFSPTQRALYAIVLAANEEAIAAAKPGVSYRDVHLLACRTLAQGLVDEGILKGDPGSLVEQGAHALFFPHGVGHLLGLDVHDMEDLGDMAGYAPGRSRSKQFGLCYLRLDRDLTAGMAVTIEPGLYLVPSILNNQALCAPFEAALDRSRLAHFSDVRGIRIEDDIVITTEDPECLTAAIPKQIDEIEALMSGG